MNNAYAKLMWENNPDTPLDADNLSEILDFKSVGKFLLLADDEEDYKKWADYTINNEWSNIEQNDEYLNKTIFNFYDNTVRRLIINPDSGQKVWEFLPTVYKKILKIKADTKISVSFVDTKNKKRFMNFSFEEDCIFTIDDLLIEGVKNFEPSTRYFVYLLVKHSYNDKAYIKIIREEDEDANFWKETYPQSSSPTGQNLISYRKIGGFKTDNTGAINPNNLWDLYTYKEEIVAGKIKVWENGEPRQISASDFQVVDNQNLFSSSSQTLTVEEALFQTRALLNNLNSKFYTNRRFGFNLQFAPFKYIDNTLTTADINDVTIRITPGFVDVLGTQVVKDEVIWFANPDVGFKINDGETLIYDAKLAHEDDGSGKVLYPGVWTVYIDFNGEFTLRHETAENGRARWIPSYFGWFDKTGKRALGKFKVRNDDGNYIETFSVTDTFELNAPTNSIHIHYGTLCPDGLLPCDGKWHDVYGIDTNVYEFHELPPLSEWGESWYVETPNYTHMMIRGADVSFSTITSGKYNPITNSGGADDNTIIGGNDEHSHSFPHSHSSGTINIFPSGVHPGEHQVNFNGSTAFVEVNTVPPGTGQKVSIYNHTHNITITGGEHSHTKENFSGSTETLSGNAALTQPASSLPKFREALICIKKI